MRRRVSGSWKCLTAVLTLCFALAAVYRLHAASSLSSSISARVQAALVGTASVGTTQPVYPLDLPLSITLTSGTGLNQADLVISKTYTIGASGTQDIDLNGVTTDALGNTVSMLRVKAILISTVGKSNTNNVLVGNAASNGFISWVGGATHSVTVRPEGLFLLAAPDATAYSVTAATADLLRLTNSAGGTSVGVDVVIIGASA